MRYPEFIKPGDTIGFAAPSFGCAMEPYKSGFDNALKKFKKLGYKTLLGPNVYKGDGIGISTDPESCGRELTEMYCGDLGECRAIMACGGGELMCETMAYVDIERIKDAESKWYSGYSDNTNFIFPSVTICDTAAIYSPCAPSFGMEPWHQNLYDTMGLLTGEKLTVSTYGKWEIEGTKDKDHPLEPYNCTEKTLLKVYDYETCETVDLIRPLSFSGRLVGGCLDILANLCGTKMDQVKEFEAKYSGDGLVWFLEACDLNVLSIRRAVWQLEQAGWFETAKGFIIGRPYNFDQPLFGLDQYTAVTEVLKRHNVPIIMDADIGHLPPMTPLIAGSYADIKAADNSMTIEMKLI